MWALHSILFLGVFPTIFSLTTHISSRERQILAAFPGYFREDVQEENSKLEAATIQPIIHVDYHGCCESTTEYEQYTTAKDLFGKDVTLVQLNSRKQVFLKETCKQAENCNSCGCQCRLAMQVFSAVVCTKANCTNPGLDGMKVTHIQVPSFCRCYNNAPAATSTTRGRGPRTVFENSRLFVSGELSKDEL
ncbi:uncharacterized protein LOC131941039 [Physella acuta]|uniref:uncharacterized protein LOC131941039 n=1 Tax=Physella acuta TaxID=109671 RepID=UPI0027DBBD87|nr:uncharacterized protein LOC131941039 [Physella acuta]